MPAPPPPNAIRALIAFPIGLAVGVAVVAAIRFILGIEIFAIPPISEGWFYEDEFTLMCAFFAGSFGFLWGSGAMYDFEKEKARQEQLALMPARQRNVPVDPDRKPGFEDNPLIPLFGAFPAMGVTLAVLAVTVILIMAIASGNLLPTGTQTTNSAAETDAFSDDFTFNFVGVYTYEGNQVGLFVIFIAIVLGGLVTTALVLAFVVYLLNRQVKIAEEEVVEPHVGEQFILVRIITFFTEWGLDMLNGISAILRPR